MSLRRGACPSLSAPMQTGDGLLARLNPVGGHLSGRQLAGLARAAERLGNGILEITARGSLQVRGLTEESAVALGVAVEALGIKVRSGLPIDISPLAGLEVSGVADPRGLAREIWARCESLGLSQRLGPKVSVTVDGGGVLGLREMLADVKLEAVAGAEVSGEAAFSEESAVTWLLRVGGTSATARELGRFAQADAVDTAVRILEAVAERGVEARARDLSDAVLAKVAGREPVPGVVPMEPMHSPVGRFALVGGGWARGFALAYGQIEGGALSAFAEVLGEERDVCLARGRGLIVPGVWEHEDSALFTAAERLGLIAKPGDPRLSIAVCAGKPACASAHLATRHLADRIVASRPDLLGGDYQLHLSGCGKQCARPSRASVTLMGVEGGFEISADGTAIPSDLKALLSELAEEQFRQRP
ncbi:precorrin-3B synthase [Chelativorans alearense]|uniref:precorrin-3B synthase n=1 Tax=Chelativorans alearense TaxID=2681495 RepID=UPI0013D09D21|nr:precorrin-3B synthase [Chelativorans alearense]